jgi:hypothetical protein
MRRRSPTGRPHPRIGLTASSHGRARSRRGRSVRETPLRRGCRDGGRIPGLASVAPRRCLGDAYWKSQSPSGQQAIQFTFKLEPFLYCFRVRTAAHLVWESLCRVRSAHALAAVHPIWMHSSLGSRLLHLEAMRKAGSIQDLANRWSGRAFRSSRPKMASWLLRLPGIGFASVVFLNGCSYQFEIMVQELTTG